MVLVLGSLLFFVGLQSCGPNVGTEEAFAWVSDPEVRLMPGSFTRDLESSIIQLEGLRNETVSAQLGARADAEGQELSVRVKDLQGPEGTKIAGSEVWVRFPGQILVDEVVGYVSDPLLEQEGFELQANTTQGIWLTLHIPKVQPAGLYTGSVAVLLNNSSLKDFQLEVQVLEETLPDPEDYNFFLNILQDAESIARWYQVPRWSDEHFRLIELFAKNLSRHGQQSITTTIVANAWRDNGIEFNRLPSMVEWRYPGEWSLEDGKSFEFDYSVFDRYVEIHLDLGIKREITCMSPIIGPGSSPDSEITYLDTVAQEERTVTIQVNTPWYEDAWSAFAKDFETHLQEKGWLSRTYLLLDEKPAEVIEGVRRVFDEAAPSLQLNISGSSGPLGTRNRLESPQWVLIYDELFDEEVFPAGTAEERRGRGQITLFYTACGERHPNTFLYSPLRESRMLPWIAAEHDVDGYIRWAWNLWPTDVWNQPKFQWPSGDMFFVYPGEEGPLDSTRWEMMQQGIQDVEAIRLLLTKAEGTAKESEIKQEVRNLMRRATRIHGCRGTSLIRDQRKRINQLIMEL
jgi:hypothetical protein